MTATANGTNAPTRRTYRDAIEALNSLQSNAATIEKSRQAGSRLAQFANQETREYLGRIGYKPEDLNALNVLHVTGTKGKGSTCAFIDSVLRHAKPEWKIGLYTSPHLVAVRERIRINGAPIPEEDFAKYFFEVWDRLEANTTRKLPETLPKPMYFRMLTLVAYHAFLSMKVDATILEVGVGGRYDCTNIVPKPVITGISALGIDHVTVLGRTIKEIAWQKAGIYKEGVPALTVNQPAEGYEVLKQVAEEVKASRFTVVPSIPTLTDLKLGLAGQHQYQNARLALHMAHQFLTITSPSTTPELPSTPSLPTASESTEDTIPAVYAEGLRNAKWPGRCQVVLDPKESSTKWYLDGAHTKDSLECCAQWYVSPDVALREGSKNALRVLVFNCTHGRNGATFLNDLLTKIGEQLKLHDYTARTTETFFDHVVFCTNVTYADGSYKGDLTNVASITTEGDPLLTQRELAAAWSKLLPSFPQSDIHVLPSIEETVKLIKSFDAHTDNNSNNSNVGEYEHRTNVLVAGSLHLVGGVIEVAGLSDVAL